MKRLLFVILAAAALWSGYWFVGASGVKTALVGWFDERRADGWQADYADLTVAGFPNRFDSTITDPMLADPATGWAWSAPFVQFLALSYRPTHVIAVWPHDQTLSTPFEKFQIKSTDLRASLKLDATPSLALNHSILTAADLAITGTARTAIDVLRLAVERQPSDDDALHPYRYGVLAEGVTLPAPLVARLGSTIALPKAMERLNLDATVTFDAPLDRDAIETARPQPRRIVLKLAKAQWGPLELAATGTLDISAQGIPKGVVSIKAERWREMLRMAVSAGALPDSVAQTAERALGILAALSGNPNSLNVALDFRNGQVALGPVPLGPAPVIRLR